MAPEQPRIEGEALDFRDEVMAQISDCGDAEAKRELTFHIELTDDGDTHGRPAFERRTFSGWRHIGKITFQRAVDSITATSLFISIIPLGGAPKRSFNSRGSRAERFADRRALRPSSDADSGPKEA